MHRRQRGRPWSNSEVALPGPQITLLLMHCMLYPCLLSTEMVLCVPHRAEVSQNPLGIIASGYALDLPQESA